MYILILTQVNILLGKIKRVDLNDVRAHFLIVFNYKPCKL
jgi:hypothetical protein